MNVDELLINYMGLGLSVTAKVTAVKTDKPKPAAQADKSLK